MSTRDPLDLLRQLGRARSSAEATEVDVAAALERIGAIVQKSAPVQRKRRLRRWIITFIAVLAGLGGGTVAWALAHRERATDPTSVECHQTAVIDGSLLVIDSDGSDPVAQCASAWPTLRPASGAVPVLAACRASNGNAAVFPGSPQVCAALGLPMLDPTLSDDDELFLVFKERLTTAVLDRGCIDPADLDQLAAGLLAESGLVDWRVKIEGPFTAAQPCGSLQFDEPSRTIYILPLPNMFGGPDGE